MQFRKIRLGIALFLMAGCSLSKAAAQSLYTLPEGVQTRWASAENPGGEKGKGAQTDGGRKGRPAVPIKAGEQVTLAEIRGSSGTVRRIWVTINDRSPAMLRGLKIEMFWDGAIKPAVSAPLGDFFGLGLGQMVAFQSAFFSSPEGKSFNCYIPMPFRTGMKIVVTNESGKDLALFFYDVDYTLGDKHDASVLYFHAHFRRENPTEMQKDFEILPRTLGKGRFLGANLGMQGSRKLYFDKWWGEGEVKIYLDGDREWPTLAGSGSEDYAGTGWAVQKQYSNLFQGTLIADSSKMRYAFYRYHVPDPIYFRNDIRVTIQQIGHTLETSAEDPLYNTGVPIYKAGVGLVEREKGSFGLFERQDDWSSCAYFYLDKPEDNLPPIQAAELRMEGLDWGGPFFDEVR
jgi:Protein of unknown function (DUF2961)